MNVMIYTLRAFFTVFATAALALWMHQEIIPGGVANTIIIVTSLMVAVLICIVAVFLPLEIFARKRKFGIIVQASPAIGAIYAVIVNFLMHGPSNISKGTLPGYLVYGVCCGIVWAITAFLNGRLDLVPQRIT